MDLAWLLCRTATCKSSPYATRTNRDYFRNITPTKLLAAFFCNSSEAAAAESNPAGQWLTVREYVPRTHLPTLGKQILLEQHNQQNQASSASPPMTALKWVAQCCPYMPRSLIQKLFRLRQVRVEWLNSADSSLTIKENHGKLQLKRISGKEVMMPGMKLYLPRTVCKDREIATDQSLESQNIKLTAGEIKYIQSLELYKDSQIIVLNKPYGLSVQGGPGIRKSMDALASVALPYDYEDGPRLVHRLDKDCSGVLVMARTKESAVLLHSLFREKTAMVSSTEEDASLSGRKLKRRYWALVIGSLRQKQGRIFAPLTKVVSNDRKSERILIANDVREDSAQEAVTDYRVLASTVHGCTWLELCTFTGRKHQVRVHCAEALGTPIVGDLKYGWSAHRKWRPMSFKNVEHEDDGTGKRNPFTVEDGSVLSERPFLHLHCRQLTMPNIAKILEQLENQDYSKMDSLKFVAPLPSHMSRSWEYMSQCSVSKQ